MPCEIGDGVEDGDGVWSEAGLGGEGLAGDGEGDGPQWSQDLDEASDGHTPVRSWRWRATARAANTMVRYASIEPFLRWNTGLAWRSPLDMRNDSSTCHRSR